jgi:hypothetical protein
MINRRRFLAHSSRAAAATVGFPHLASSAGSRRSNPGENPNRFLEAVADGMSLGTPTDPDRSWATALGPVAEGQASFIQSTDRFQPCPALAKIDFRNASEPLISEAGLNAEAAANPASTGRA